MCLFLGGCLGSTRDPATSDDVATADDGDDDANAVEEPLTLELQSITLRHGSVILSASMDNGSADLSVWLDGSTDASCANVEVGRGFATRTGFVWRFDAKDLARAYACNLVVKARMREDGHRVIRKADVVVNIDLASEDDDRGKIAGQELDQDTQSTRMTFQTMEPAPRLHASGLVIGPDDDDDDGKRFKTIFDVPNLELAKAVLSQRPVRVARVAFAPSVSFGNLSLDLELQAADDPNAS